MRFAKRVFTAAGIWGLLVVPPLFFLSGTIGRQDPPAITHPEYFYGFAAVGTVWQIAFLVIASDPMRFRPLMPVAALEKAGWVTALIVLYAQQRVAASTLPFGAIDLLLGMLFVLSFVRTGGELAQAGRPARLFTSAGPRAASDRAGGASPVPRPPRPA
jgi:hypothetical protein